MDNYEASQGLGDSLQSSKDAKASHIFLAFGPERGWSDAERALLLKDNWKFVHLGARVLRLEMAVVSAIAITADILNLWKGGTGSSLSHLCD
jgi:RsmE family RNA methyltransferase